MKPLLLFGLTLLSTTLAQAQPVRQSMLEADNTYSSQLARDGRRMSMLAHTAPEAVVFEDGEALNAQATWQERSDAQEARFARHAVWADVAQSGDLAYTTGPWMQGEADRPAATGQYVSVWQRRNGGDWKLVVDMNVEHAPVPDVGVDVAGPSVPPAQAMPMAAPASVLLNVERKFAADELVTPAKTYELNLSKEGRLYRPGQLALTGNSAQVVSENPGFAYNFVPSTVRLAAAADLGFVVGTLRRPSPEANHPDETGSYLRIWRRENDGGWKLALEMLNFTSTDAGVPQGAAQK